MRVTLVWHSEFGENVLDGVFTPNVAQDWIKVQSHSEKYFAETYVVNSLAPVTPGPQQAHLPDMPKGNGTYTGFDKPVCDVLKRCGLDLHVSVETIDNDQQLVSGIVTLRSPGGEVLLQARSEEVR